MTTENRGRRIVVGYDGSPASRAALACAAERAGEDGRIYVVHAYSVPADYLGVPNYQNLLDDAPARAIADVAAARKADEIIVGTRGFGRARALLGSVAHQLIHLAECPITVIPERVVDRQQTLETAGAAS